MGNTASGLFRPTGLDRAAVTAALKYALKPELVALYAVVYAGLAITDWNVFRLFLIGLYLAPEPIVRTALNLGGLVTSFVGYVIAAAGAVGVLKTVLEDVLHQSENAPAYAGDDA